MKIQITYRLFYDNHNSTKIVNINNCENIKHAEERFKIWAKGRFKAAKDIKIIDSGIIEKLNTDSDIEYLKNMFKMN